MKESVEKPDFLPITEFPIPREVSLDAAQYLLQLEVDHGPIHENEQFDVLVGLDSISKLNKTQRRIIRQVSQVLASEIPRTREFKPEKTLSILERA